jgi:hypothetical protein
MNDLIRAFTERGDLAHLALFLWAAAASAAFLFTLRELAAASRRFDDFVRELSLFNRRIRPHLEKIQHKAPRAPVRAAAKPAKRKPRRAR